MTDTIPELEKAVATVQERIRLDESQLTDLLARLAKAKEPKTYGREVAEKMVRPPDAHKYPMLYRHDFDAACQVWFHEKASVEDARNAIAAAVDAAYQRGLKDAGASRDGLIEDADRGSTRNER